jgi:hypothetical protein
MPPHPVASGSSTRSTLNGLSVDPERRTVIDMTVVKALPDGSGYLCAGEGSYGSEGFFGRLGQDRNLVWVVYLEESNPFVDAVVDDGRRAKFTSSSGVSIAVEPAPRR